jgi:hypothetical protein
MRVGMAISASRELRDLDAVSGCSLPPAMALFAFQ